MWIYIFSTIAVASVVTGVIFFTAPLLYPYVIEFLLLLIILFAYLVITRISAHGRWIENRFIAERLRTACYFTIANIEIEPILIPPYMGFTHKRNDWMIHVFAEIWNQLPVMKGTPDLLFPSMKDYILNAWINDQIIYHKRKARQSRRFNSIDTVSGWVIFLIAILAPVVHIVMLFTAGEHNGIFDKILTFFAIIMPAIGAAMLGIKVHRDHERMEQRSMNMAEVLSELSERLQETTDKQEFVRMMHEADEIMLRENQDWLASMKLMKIDLPV